MIFSYPSIDKTGGEESNVQIWYNYVLSSLLPWGYSIANVLAGSQHFE